MPLHANNPPLLRARRLAAQDAPQNPTRDETHEIPAVLGGLAYGEPVARTPSEAAFWLPCEGANRSNQPALDAWTTPGPLTQGQQGAVHWRSNGHWLFGVLSCDQAATGENLAPLTARIYQDIFKTLHQTQCPQLLRVWTYLPRIHAQEYGLERYRCFNSGRQQAFLDAKQSAFEGAPVACALGVAKGALRVGFLAGRTAALAIENPRQVSAYHYPADYGPHSPTFSRAALLPVGGGQVALLISGTASIVGHRSVHVGDVRAQTSETLANLQAVLDAAHLQTSARFDLTQADCTIYMRHLADAAAVRECFEQALGAESYAARQAVYVQADICRSDLSVEIEAQVWATGEILK
jgi:chorismate lyase / 3-hydroxybenzoate synthase